MQRQSSVMKELQTTHSRTPSTVPTELEYNVGTHAGRETHTCVSTSIFRSPTVSGGEMHKRYYYYYCRNIVSRRTGTVGLAVLIIQLFTLRTYKWFPLLQKRFDGVVSLHFGEVIF